MQAAGDTTTFEQDIHDALPEIVEEEEGNTGGTGNVAHPQQYHTESTILCCMCGSQIKPNAANMCIPCLRTQVDVTEGIPRELSIHHCRSCGRFSRPPWASVEWESRELLAICLKKIPKLNKVKLVDASFIWTPPSSRRIRVKLTIQKEAINGVKLQQSFPVEFVVENLQCDDCQRSFTPHSWKACVQVRQRVNHKKTFFYLEQLIIKYKAHENCINIEQVPEGVDFHFNSKSNAMKFVDFLQSVIPCRHKSAKELVSHDVHTSHYNYKHTLAVEIVPLCKDDLVVLPPKLAASLGSFSPLALVYRVSNHVNIVDPVAIQTAEITSEKFYRCPCQALMSAKQLTEFTVLDVTPVIIEGASRKRGAPSKAKRKVKRRNRGKLQTIEEDGEDEPALDDDDERESVAVQSGAVSNSLVSNSRFSRKMGLSVAHSLASSGMKSGNSSVGTTVAGGPRGKFLLADVEVARTKDLGANDEIFTVRSHLGNILKPGDSVLGYDLASANINDEYVNESQDVVRTGKASGKGKAKSKSGGGVYNKKVELPDVVLVRKHYPKWRSKSRQRNWKLQRLQMDDQKKAEDKAKEDDDYEMFLRDVEEDRYIRKDVPKVKAEAASVGSPEDDGDYEEDFPHVKVDEMMEKMNIQATEANASSVAEAAPEDKELE
eukprot:gb/GECG01013188.1/.p1 GENE.gb/GECG01013188.1/~~gb/GECG01013188.1/.p1  ORF type:complete len:660 (+),score=114.92 gb/GECG01013188.1/:1-1980(+)